MSLSEKDSGTDLLREFLLKHRPVVDELQRKTRDQEVEIAALRKMVESIHQEWMGEGTEGGGWKYQIMQHREHVKTCSSIMPRLAEIVKVLDTETTDGRGWDWLYYARTMRQRDKQIGDALDYVKDLKELDLKNEIARLKAIMWIAGGLLTLGGGGAILKLLEVL